METTIIILSILVLIFLTAIWYYSAIHYDGYNKRIDRIEKNIDNLNERYDYLKSYLKNLEDISTSLIDKFKINTESQNKINKSNRMIIKEFVKDRNKLVSDINTLMNNQKEMCEELSQINKQKEK